MEQLLHPEDEEDESQVSRAEERELKQFLKKQGQESAAKDQSASAAATPPQPVLIATTTTSTVVVPPPAGMEKVKLDFYLRKIIVRGDGSREVQIIKDPAVVKDYMAKQKQAEKAGGKPTSTKRSFRAPLSSQEELQRLARKREKRRIQERNRRARKNQEKQKELQRKIESGELNGLAQSRSNNSKVRMELLFVGRAVLIGFASIQLVCKRCGMVGHMKTNRICPLWREGIEDEEDIAEGIRPKRERKSNRSLIKLLW